jgi:hypothetical protein
MKPIQVDVFALFPEAWGLCTPCGQLLSHMSEGAAPVARRLDDLPPDWQEAADQLSRLVLDLQACYGRRVSIRLIDPRSLPGLISAIRHRVWRYPTFVVAGREKVMGLDRPRLEAALRAAGLTPAG